MSCEKCYSLERENEGLEKELEAAVLERDCAEEAKRIFLSNTSHEIRTPLNGIIAATQLLRQTKLTPEQYDLLGMVEESGLTLLSVLADILDFSCVNLRHVALDKKRVLIRDVVEQSIDSIVTEANNNDIRVTYRVGRNAEYRRIYVDPARLRQVLCALLSNSVKFNKPGGDITVYSDLITQEGKEYLQLVVKDTGVGMTEDVRNRLFKEFVQGESSRTRKYGGSGLGLAIASKIVHAMGGNMSVDTEVSIGSAFTVTLPMFASLEGASNAYLSDAMETESARDSSSCETYAENDIDHSRHCVEWTGDMEQEKQELENVSFFVDIQHQGLRDQVKELVLVHGAAMVDKGAIESRAVDVWITTSDQAGTVVAGGWRRKPLIVLGEKSDIPLGVLPMVHVVNIPLKYQKMLLAIRSAISGRSVDPTRIPLYRDAMLLHGHWGGSGSSSSNESSENQFWYHRRSVDNSELSARKSQSLMNLMSTPPSSNKITDKSPPEPTKTDCPRILVAEDNEINVKVVTKIIQHVRPDVLIDVVSSGTEVLQVTERIKYDLILMDIHMPEMDGLEATKRLMNRKQTSEHPAIVALSADTLQALPDQCIALGMKGFVSKPFRVEDVERVLSLIK